MIPHKADVPRKTASLPNLRRFAGPHLDPEGSDEATTICGKVLNAARDEFDRAAGGNPPLDAARQRIEALLGVVSYCYTKGVFSSAEIEERLWTDAAFVSTFGRETPTADKIRSFRRQHGKTILATIEHALQDFCSRPAHSGNPKIICTTAGAVDWARCKAHELLEMAKATDSVERD